MLGQRRQHRRLSSQLQLLKMPTATDRPTRLLCIIGEAVVARATSSTCTAQRPPPKLTGMTKALTANVTPTTVSLLLRVLHMPVQQLTLLPLPVACRVPLSRQLRSVPPVQRQRQVRISPRRTSRQLDRLP